MVPIPPTAAQHARSTAALCLATFSVSYMLISVFPYSGFMAIQLLPGRLNEENAGLYAGLISSSFMVGRAFSSYSWGRMADSYGRVTCLTFSLLLSSLLSLAFGVSSSYWLALTWRFLLGLSNGIMPLTKTAVSEIAMGDKKLETRGMGLVMGMWGWGFLVAPAISGVCSDPLKQFPGWLQVDSPFYTLLDEFPFFLPNLVGAALGLVALFAVNFFVEETLPERKVRSLSHVPSDIWSTMRRVLSIIPEDLDEETTPLQRNNKRDIMDYKSHQSIEEEGGGHDSDDEEIDAEFEEMAMQMLEQDADGAIRESQAAYDESVALLSTSKDGARKSIAESVTRRSTLGSNNAQQRISRLSVASASRPPPATMASLWAQKSTRRHMLLYWVSSFVMVAVDEGFPLFCIAKAAGLGLTEVSIGRILSVSGLMFAIAQYVVYAALVHWFGLYGSIRLGSITMGPMTALVPISLWLNHSSEKGDDQNQLTFSALLFLSVLMAFYRVFGLVYFSSLTVALNRTVLPTHRGTMNGLSTLGGSVAKALGPTFAGALVAFSFSSGFFSPHVGAIFMWLLIGGLGAVVAVLSHILIHDDEEDESNAELKV